MIATGIFLAFGLFIGFWIIQVVGLLFQGLAYVIGASIENITENWKEYLKNILGVGLILGVMCTLALLKV